MRAPGTSVFQNILLLLLLHATVCCGIKESEYDKERDKRMNEQHKDMDQIQILKLREAAREKSDKKQDEIRRINREEYLRRHPTELYNARIMGHYGMKDGKPVRFVPISGTVYDILSPKRVLVYIPPPPQVGRSEVVMVVLEKEQTLSKGQKFSIPNIIEAGTYGYTQPDGTQVSARMYKETPGLTLKEFLELKKNGYRFMEETAG